MPDVVDLPQLLDLSLGYPEVGAANFKTLHKLLLEIISRVDGQQSAVTPSGIDAARDAKAANTPGIQKSSYNALSAKVSKIERDLSHMSTALPDSKDIIDKVKTSTPLTDLWQHMQLNKKVENNEDGIKTAMNLIEQLIKDMAELKDENKNLRSRLDGIDMDKINKQLKELDNLREQMKAMSELTDKLKDVDSHQAQLDALQRRLDALPPAEDIVTWPGLEDGLNGVRGEFAAYRPESRAKQVESTTRATAMTPTAASSAPNTSRPLSGRASHTSVTSSGSDGPSNDMIGVLEKLGSVNKRHEELKKRVEDLEREMLEKANKEDVSGKLPDDLLDRINEMNARLSELDELRAKDAEAIKRAQKAMVDLQEELAKLQQLTDFLNSENDAKSRKIEKLSEDTERLDKTKADKDYVDAELDAKADKTQVDGKVNRSVFDSTISDLQKMIDDLLAKLLAYEDAWKQAHAKMEEDMDDKIDRTELDRLKSYIDRKLKEFNSKLRQNSGMFNPFCEDAAGLKKQLLPFNCLSCDKPVVVSNANQLTQSTPLAGLGDAFSANKSSRPYTTFELDQIRQHAKSLLNADYVMDYYSTPRSAGGSHTMTYPHKRVTKQAYREAAKDVYEDIPPEVLLPVRDEAEIVGADGHVYRGRFDVNSALDSNPTQPRDGRPTTPNRPKTSPARRPGSARPGNMARPRTAAPSRVSSDSERPASGRERPASARDRPTTSMALRDDDEGGMADNEPPVVMIETVADLETPPTQPANAPDLKA